MTNVLCPKKIYVRIPEDSFVTNIIEKVVEISNQEVINIIDNN
jgi:hypothetical protein